MGSGGAGNLGQLVIPHLQREVQENESMWLANPVLLLYNSDLFYNFRVEEISPKPQPQGHSVDLHQSEQHPDFLLVLFTLPLS